MKTILLEVGKNDIVSIKNSNTSKKRDKLFLTPNTNLSGPIYLEDDTVHLGYNEQVECMDSASAETLLSKIIEIY